MNRYFRNVTISVILATISVILINLIFYYGFVRFDFTSNRVYSLSKVSKKILKQLDDNVLIRAVFSRELPEQYRFNKLYVEDMLKEYRTYSHGKVRYEFIDPTDPKAKIKHHEVLQMGIAPLRFQILAKDKYEIKEGFMGIAMLYGDNREVIPVVSNIETLEYDITSAIKRLSMKTKKVIGIVTGHQENTLSGERFAQIRSQLTKLYDLKTINLKEDSDLSSVDALLIISPKTNFEDKELFLVDQFILSGKPVAFLLDSYDIDTQNFWARKIYSNIFDLLSSYGIRFKEGLVVDPQCEKVALRMQQGFFIVENIVDYPFMPIITQMNKTHPVVKDLGRVVLPFVSPMEVKADQDINYTTLLETSKYSFLKKDIYSVNPMMVNFRPGKESLKGPFVVAADLRGKFKSYIASNKEKMKALKLPSTYYVLSETEEKKESRIIVFSTAEFIDNELALLGNIVDFIAQDYDLSTIRSKKVGLQPLRQLSYGVKLIYRYFIILFLPAFTILVGLYRWYLRKSRNPEL